MTAPRAGHGSTLLTVVSDAPAMNCMNRRLDKSVSFECARFTDIQYPPRSLAVRNELLLKFAEQLYFALII